MLGFSPAPDLTTCRLMSWPCLTCSHPQGDVCCLPWLPRFLMRSQDGPGLPGHARHPWDSPSAPQAPAAPGSYFGKFNLKDRGATEHPKRVVYRAEKVCLFVFNIQSTRQEGHEKPFLSEKQPPCEWYSLGGGNLL